MAKSCVLHKAVARTVTVMITSWHFVIARPSPTPMAKSNTKANRTHHSRVQTLEYLMTSTTINRSSNNDNNTLLLVAVDVLNKVEDSNIYWIIVPSTADSLGIERPLCREEQLRYVIS
jgi:hypothetical protein